MGQKSFAMHKNLPRKDGWNLRNPYVLIVALLLFSMLLLPLASIPGSAPEEGDAGQKTEEFTEKMESFQVFNHKTGKVEKIKAEEYIFGAVAAEISPDSEEEALKAQAVVCYTFACRKKWQRSQSGQGDYDLSTDPAKDQAYCSKDEAKEKWGENYDKWAERLQKAVDAVKGLLITYEGQPILAAYHCISGGKTESAENVWGQDYPYLRPVESVGDLLSPEYMSEVRVSPDQFKEKAAGLGASLEGEPGTWLKEPARSQSGTVLTYTLGGASVTGSQMRSAFGLRSSNFDLSVGDDGQMVFTVRGYGHGVGMSQYGANYMAAQGSGYLEILSWYYPGCQLSKTK